MRGKASLTWLLVVGCAGCTGAGDGDAAHEDATGGSITSTGETGASVEDDCERDEDCGIFQDCCTCIAIPRDDNPVPCGFDCENPRCLEAGVSAARCHHGRCTLQKRSCDDSETESRCDTPVPRPECSIGNRPETLNWCYTGACIPEWACDAVSSCAACRDDEFCVSTEVGSEREVTSCVPTPTRCVSTVDCTCAGEAACGPDGPGPCDADFACSEMEAGWLSCTDPGACSLPALPHARLR